jgi:CBS domain-containing protein
MLNVQTILDRKGADVVTMDGEKNALDAAQKMNERHIGAVVVTSGEKAIGIFTERDILRRIVASGRSAGDTRISEVMTSPVACVRRNTTLGECRAIMTRKRIRHLPVVERGKLFGIVSAGDVMAAEAEEQQATIEYLHEYLFGRV